MTPQTFLPRQEWLLPDVNESLNFLTPSLKESLSACCLLHCWLVEHYHGSCAPYNSPASSDLFYWYANATPAMDHRTVNWNLFARLSTTIHQYPSSTTLEFYLVSSPFPWRMTRIRGSHCRLRRKCSESHSRRGVIHASDTVLLTTVWYDNSLC